MRAKPRHAAPAKPRSVTGNSLHPRNRHQGRYDFAQLIQACPELAGFVALNAYGNESIDFANPGAVKTLNRALLQLHYGICGWDIPPDFLCPPIPGRADYLHYLADLLAASNGGAIPRGAVVRVLDIGVGANCVYPLIGHSEYGWRFVGTDINRGALASAQAILDANSGLNDAIELRWQSSATAIFNGMVQADELFDLTLCNPPFHASQADATAGTQRKWQNLGKGTAGKKAPTLNFGGQGAELWCVGGEEAFICRMIAESARIPSRCFWFSTLVSKSASLPAVYRALKQARVQASQTIEMAQGQKKSRLVAWTFLDKNQQQAWRQRWQG